MSRARGKSSASRGTVKERRTDFAPEQELYQAYSVEEDRERTNTHYEQPVEFFYTLTGGDWNVYSATFGPAQRRRPRASRGSWTCSPSSCSCARGCESWTSAAAGVGRSST